MNIPNFEIERELGKGGMSTVYLARQVLLNRQVALKVMSPEYAGGKAFQEAFLHEGKVVARLEHPNIVRIYDIGMVDEVIFYMAMEYLSGGSLRDRLNLEKLTPDAALRVLQQVGQGLEYAHQQGFIHRDIKPENILFRKDGTAVLTDFGIAKLHDSTGDMTRMGYTAGTAHYMSPEQASSERLDYRSDVYSLGLVAFEMLSGEKVCKADSIIRAIHQHTSVPPPDLPTEYRLFQPVLHKALAKQAEARYSSVGDFVSAFARVVDLFRQDISGETRIYVPEQQVDIPRPVATTAAVVLEPDRTPFWRQPLFISSLVGTLLIGLAFYWFLPALTQAPALPSSSPADGQSSGGGTTPPSVTDTLSSTEAKPAPTTAISGEAKPYPGLQGKIFVVRTGGADLHAAPVGTSGTLARIDAGQRVTALDDVLYADKLNGEEGNWMKVSALGSKGYMFDRNAFPLNQSNASRIKFPYGAVSVEIDGSVNPGETRRYVLRALHGQTMRVSALPQPSPGVLLFAYGDDMNVLAHDAPAFSARLPATQDYYLTVFAGGTQRQTYRYEINIK